MNIEEGTIEKRACVEWASFASHGFVVLRSFFTDDEVASFRETLAPLADSRRPGRRGLLQHFPRIAALARDKRILNVLTEMPGKEPFAVRGILFDKTAQVNWAVGWHQDLAIAVKQRADVPGFGPWSIKDSVVHAHAPVRLLERMLTVRVHLDDTSCANGALRVVPGSHLAGKLEDAAIESIVSRNGSITCVAGAGDLLIMRPLLLHASSPAVEPAHRRVVHIEYAVDELPPPLEWFERVA